ncbi:MAG: ArsR/SmtB family transcription factor [Candidatus Hodarchaeota archaeon]
MPKESPIITSDPKNISEDLLNLILDPTRSKILSLIHLYGEITQKDIEKHLGLSRGTISHHLKKMIERGLLEVSISPTGRLVKTYKLQSFNLKLQMNRKRLLNLPLDDSSSLLIDFIMSIALEYRMFGNTAVETVNSLKKFQPFDNIEEDSDRNLIATVKGKKIIIPSLIMIQAGPEQALFIRKKTFEILDELQEKFLNDDKDRLHQADDSISYLINLAVFPFPRELVKK